MFSGIDTSGSGMAMAKRWLEISGNNISNINTTRGADGDGPYKRQSVVLEEKTKFEQMLGKEVGSGVQIKEVLQDDEVKQVYNPDHPDSGENGYVSMPNINLTAEMTNIMAAQRIYESNLSTFNANKKVMEKELQIGQY